MGLNFLTTDSEIFYKRLDYEREVSAIQFAFKKAQLELEQKRDTQVSLLHSVYQQQKEIIKKNKDQIPIFVRISKKDYCESLCLQDSDLQEYEIKHVERFNAEIKTVTESGTQTEEEESVSRNINLVLCRNLDSFEIVDEGDYNKSYDEIIIDDISVISKPETIEHEISKHESSKNEITNFAEFESDEKIDLKFKLIHESELTTFTDDDDEISNHEKSETSFTSSDDQISNQKTKSSSDTAEADGICAHITSSPVKSPRNSTDIETHLKDNENINSIKQQQTSINLFDDFGSSLDLSNSDTPSDDDCFETDSDDQRNMIKLQETDEFDITKMLGKNVNIKTKLSIILQNKYQVGASFCSE